MANEILPNILRVIHGSGPNPEDALQAATTQMAAGVRQVPASDLLRNGIFCKPKDAPVAIGAIFNTLLSEVPLDKKVAGLAQVQSDLSFPSIAPGLEIENVD